MKTNLLKAIAFAIVMTPLYNCAVEPIEQQVLQEELSTIEIENEIDLTTPCVGQNPQARVTNNNDIDVNFEIHDSLGNLLDAVYGLNPGEVSDWKNFPVGVTTFTVSTAESSKPVTISMGVCMAYDVTINENNQLDTDIPIQL